jgi:hypothetical protein
VEIDCGNESMSADQVEIFQDTNVMIATGNVVFTSGGSRIAADRLEYNTRTRTGTFFNGFGTSTMHEEQGPAQADADLAVHAVGAVRPAAAARRASRCSGRGSRHLLLRREDLEGGAGEVPHHPRRLHHVRAADRPGWQLTSGTVTLNLKHYAVLTNSLFRVKSVPVPVLSDLLYPINKENRAPAS